MRRGLRGGLIAATLGLTVCVSLKLLLGLVLWEPLLIAALGFAVGAFLPQCPGRLYLRAGRELGVGEGLLAAWELSRRNEPVLLQRLWEAISPSLRSPARLLYPNGLELGLLCALLFLGLSLRLVPSLPFSGVVSPYPPPEVSAEKEDLEGHGKATPAGEPEALSPPRWEGGRIPPRVPEAELPTAELPPEASSAPRSPAAPVPAERTGGEPGISPGEETDAGMHQAISEPIPQIPPPLEATVPAPGEARVGEPVLEAEEGEPGEGESPGESRVLRPGEESNPAGKEGASEVPPLPRSQQASAAGKEELGGKAEGEPPVPGEAGSPPEAEPSRKTRVKMRPAEGAARKGTVLSPPPEPPGGEEAPYIPELGELGVHLSPRGLPAGAEELVRRYFEILAQEGER